ncbi:hypothetical protein [Hymenobacter actinosclerus]|uniref:Uncharacterized protein n=1 Tax=Hymenobacter actinosclerus TaxID=82805 RepID=A0A1I0I6M9_9BACT|nr:hypothetical protein [Hymenobacter actinosclerus]SET92319.1 hypothetical protein SAMN04487998_3177 [Hymenobacter actinosclerus]
MRYLLIGALLLTLAATDARAQLESSSPASQRAASRKALRDARKVEARYKESHLTVRKKELRMQAGGRLAALPLPAGQPDYKFDRDGTPRVSEQSKVHFRLRRKKPNAAPVQ